MISQTELRKRIAALVNGDEALDEFEDWFTVASWNAHKDSSLAAQELVGAVELRLDEHSSGHLSYEELSHELEALVRAEPLHISLSVNSSVAVSFHISISAVAANYHSYSIKTQVSSVAVQRLTAVPA